MPAHRTLPATIVPTPFGFQVRRGDRVLGTWPTRPEAEAKAKPR